MAIVTYMGQEYSCSVALKGADYVHLLNEAGQMTVAFDGVSDFSGFKISGGSWVTPTAVNECYLAVVKDDGTVGRGGHRCCDIPTALADLGDVIICDIQPTTVVEGKWYLIKSEV